MQNAPLSHYDSCLTYLHIPFQLRGQVQSKLVMLLWFATLTVVIQKTNAMQCAHIESKFGKLIAIGIP
jgi:hypothetical protein